MGSTTARIHTRGRNVRYRFLHWLDNYEGESKEGTKSETQGSLTLSGHAYSSLFIDLSPNPFNFMQTDIVIIWAM
jgi:hypothetical protein